ncbi:MAG TPA: exonuclease SbcCD subunit D [Kineosporiaceae bacterium]|nr:exonuclease SbcCD subunit D [Kineosporiaceae bacterium]
MKLLHTSDWHVGKILKGRDRLAEQRDVLAEIVTIAKQHQVDAVLVAGDLYETAAPSAEAQKLVVSTLRKLARAGIEVIAIAGNHDHAGTFEAYRAVMRDAGIHLYGAFRPAGNGGVHRFTARSTGEQAVVAILPFLSQRYAVRAAEIVENTPAQNVGSYDQMVRDILANLTAEFSDNTVNLVLAHLTCTGGALGGGERAAQSIFEYHVPASVFPVEAHYVALGHLHRRQSLPAACPVHYSGAPLAVDFGEQDNTNVVCLVEVTPTTPAQVTDIPIRSGQRLRTVTGTVEQLLTKAIEFGDDYLRVWVNEPTRAGLRDQIADALPNALEIRIHPDFATATSGRKVTIDHATRTPGQLFADYCAAEDVADARVATLFGQLHDQVTHPSI